jgi:hypothetical protein
MVQELPFVRIPAALPPAYLMPDKAHLKIPGSYRTGWQHDFRMIVQPLTC